MEVNVLKRLKKQISIIFLMGVIFLGTLNTEVSANSEKRVIRIGYSTNSIGLVQDIESTTHKGYGYDLLEKVEEISDIQLEYVPIEGSLIEAVQDGDVDVAGLLVYNDDRGQRAEFSDIPIGRTYSILVTEDLEQVYNDPLSLDGKVVSTYIDNPAQLYLNNYCRNNNISVEYIYSESSEYMDVEADLYLTFSNQTKVDGTKTVLNLGVHNTHLVSNINDTQDMDYITEILYKVITTEGSLPTELEIKYQADDRNIIHRTLSPNEIAKLQEKPITVGYLEGFQPIVYKDDEGNAGGAMVDVLNELSDMYNFEVEYYPYSITDSIELYKDYDILLTMYGDTQKTLEYYQPTESYYDMQLYAQINPEVYGDTTTKKEVIEEAENIGVMNYQSIDYDEFLDYFPNNKIILYNEFNEALDDFANKKIDAILATESSVPYASLYLDDVEKVSVATDVFVPMKIFLNNNISNEFYPIFNIMLDNLTQDDYEHIINENSNQYLPNPGFFEFIIDYWYLFLMLACLIIGIFLWQENEKNKEKQKQLEIAYNTDCITGISSLVHFRKLVEEKLKDVKDSEYEIISLDIDMFRTINSYYSTDRGTEMIKAIAKSLKEAFKDSSAYITRRTADQFLIFRKKTEGLSIKNIYDVYILPALREVIGEKYNLSMSFGSYTIVGADNKASTIINYADTARSSGKNIHKTSFKTFDVNMLKDYENKVNITFRMEQALRDREFKIVLQPKVSFDTLKINGAEALVRWHQKLGGDIYPDAFIPVFEENGFILELDMYVLEETCKFIVKNFRKTNIPQISVNLSPHSVLDKNIIHKIKDIVDKYNLKPSNIELEITESAVIADEKIFVQKVKHLKELGFSIAIDDFGAGVSSLNRLSALDADVLKLDKAFFDLKEQGGKSSVVIEDVIKMAGHLNMKVVAEGVETFAQAIWLRNIKCDSAQGYYFERPISTDDFLKLLEEEHTYKLSIK